MIKFAKVEKRLLGTENDYGWFPIIALSGKIGIDDITNSIMNRCTLTEVDITACLKAFQRVVIEYLKNGYSVSLGDLGTFRPSLRSGIYSKEMGNYVAGGRKVADTVYESDGETVKELGVTSNDIRSLKVVFNPSSEIKRSLNRNNLQFAFSCVKRTGSKRV